ncbi:MAG: efflux RND transporter periplasmic adaptor subunit [Mucilaginibacter sp.]
MKNVCLLVFAVFALTACKQKKEEKEPSNYTVKGDIIVIPDSSNIKSKLKLTTITEEPYRLQMVTAGTVKAIPTQYAEIAPPFSGRVIKSYMRLGARVTTNTPLFEISSPDFMAAQKAFFQEKSQMLQAEKTLKRQKDLKDHGVGSEKDMEEAATSYEIEKKEYENAIVGIKVFKANPDNITLGQPLIVYSPINGEIIENTIVVGQFIKDDAARVAIVAELNKVWVVGQVKEKDIRYIHELDQCSIDIPALPEKHITGKIYHVNDIIDEDTRSVQILIECNNADHTLKPGMYVNVDFSNAPTKAILVPTTSILQMNESSFVFVQNAKNTYQKRKVETAGTDSNRTVIKSGLKPGDVIVSEGGFYLSNVQ